MKGDLCRENTGFFFLFKIFQTLDVFRALKQLYVTIWRKLFDKSDPRVVIYWHFWSVMDPPTQSISDT